VNLETASPDLVAHLTAPCRRQTVAVFHFDLTVHSATGVEVDLVIDTPAQIVAIECKLAKVARPGDGRGLRSLCELTQKKTQSFIINCGETRELFNGGTLALGYADFLGNVLPQIE